MSRELRPLDHGAIARASTSTLRRTAATAGVYAVVALTILGPAISYKPEPYTGEGSPLRQFAYILLLLMAIVAARPWVKPSRLIDFPLMLALAVGWCWLSLSWSIAPDIALRRLTLTTMVIWLIFLLVSEIGTTRTLAAIRTCLLVTLIANYLAVFLFPAFAIHQTDELFDPGLVGDWRGVMLHKNFAGAICVFTIISFLFDSRQTNRVVRILVLLATTYFLARTVSKTSMGIGVLAIILGGMFLKYKPKYAIFAWTIIVITIAAMSESSPPSQGVIADSA